MRKTLKSRFEKISKRDFLFLIDSLFEIDDEQEKGNLSISFHTAVQTHSIYLADAVALLCDFEESVPIDQITSQFNVSLRNEQIKVIVNGKQYLTSSYRGIAKNQR